jgi:hypothetical protein
MGNLSDFGEIDMRPFELQYKGSLHSDQGGGARRRSEIQEIRRAFHRQLPKAWRLNTLLHQKSLGNFFGFPYRGEIYRIDDTRTMRCDPDWAKVKRRNIDFVPLVIRASQMSMVCELDIWLRWRESKQGGIFKRSESKDSNFSFDIDSRLKGLIDALAVPEANALPDDTSVDPSPFLVLMENDNLVNRLSIKAEPNSLPPSDHEKDAYVEIEITLQVHMDEPGEEF